LDFQAGSFILVWNSFVKIIFLGKKKEVIAQHLYLLNLKNQHKNFEEVVETGIFTICNLKNDTFKQKE
jgi:hypothetical protein